MNSIVIVYAIGFVFALYLFLIVCAWINRRNYMRLDESAHKSTIRLAEQLDIAWRRNRRQEREL